MMYPWTFNKNLAIVWQNRVQRNQETVFGPTWYSNLSYDLEIRSSSPKSNPLIPLLQWCIHLSMIRIHLLVHEIGCIQAFFVQL